MPAGYRNTSLTDDAFDALDRLTAEVTAHVGRPVTRSNAVRILAQAIIGRDGWINPDATDQLGDEIWRAARNLGIPVA